MHQFLNSIAAGYIQAHRANLSDFIFVFPNTRSAKYFKEFLKANDPLDASHQWSMCITMTEHFEKASGLKVASINELTMLLYDIYRSIAGEENARSFDRFRFWGEMLIKDFDDVDRYLANPHELFKNVNNFKEIQSTYLTDDQLRIIRTYWHSPLSATEPDATLSNNPLPASSPNQFWLHLQNALNDPNEGSDTKSPLRHYIQLWQILHQLYSRFTATLASQGQCYPGMAYRKVASRVKELRVGLQPSDPTYVFIGFNKLSTAEILVLEQMQAAGKAHFYWDYNPTLMDRTAGQFIARYAAQFTASLPSLHSTFTPLHPTPRQVEIISVAGNVAQTKVAAHLIDRQPDSAIVLPDENLLLPMVKAVPESITALNVTMGYPLRLSSIAQFFHAITLLQLSARRRKDQPTEFLHHDVLRLLSLPCITATLAHECNEIKQMMLDQRLFNLPAGLLTHPFFAQIFAEVDIRNHSNSAAYICQALNALTSLQSITPIDRAACEALNAQINEIDRLASLYNIDLGQSTLFYLLNRVLFSKSLQTTAPSFNSLQIMGMLETRCLGFDKVIILSMNDATYPGRRSSKSFIPETLRQAYGLPTYEHEQADLTYQFYRILNSASSLTLLYNASTNGPGAGEPSRLLRQLNNYTPQLNITHHQAILGGEIATTVQPLIGSTANIEKQGKILEILNQYRDPNHLYSRKLSASALKTYLECPRRFCLERILDLRPDDSNQDEFNALTFGNVIHETAEQLFKPYINQTITQQTIQHIITHQLDRQIQRAINIHSAGLPATITSENNDTPLPNPDLFTTPLRNSDAQYAPILREYLLNMLKHEPTPLTFLGAEISETFHWQITHDLGLNFTMKIDRLDQVQQTIRFIDYKTGADKPDFTPNTIFQEGAIFQLLTYCKAYLALPQNSHISPQSILPQLYAFQQINDNGFPPIRFKTLTDKYYHPLESYAEADPHFTPLFIDKMREIFNPEIPFTPTTDPKACNYCNIRHLCHQS